MALLRRYFFWLASQSQNQKHLFAAESMAEVESWMLAVSRASHYLRNQNRIVIKSGWVAREGRSHKGVGCWDDVFITLRRGQIDVFEDEDGGEYRGTLGLENATMHMVENAEIGRLRVYMYIYIYVHTHSCISLDSHRRPAFRSRPLRAGLGQQYSLQSIKGSQYPSLICIRANRQKAYIATKSLADAQSWMKAIDLAIIMNGCLPTTLPDASTYFLQNADKMTLEEARKAICAATKIGSPHEWSVSVVIGGEVLSLELTDRIEDIMRRFWDINIMDAIEQKVGLSLV